MKNTGIWLDSDKAIIITLTEKNEFIHELDSNIEHYNIHGGARSSTPYGPQDAVSDSKLMERKKHQFDQFYKEIMENVKDSDAITVFGPAEAKVGLDKLMRSDHNISKKYHGYQTADSMTNNQVKALVRNYFTRNLAS